MDTITFDINNDRVMELAQHKHNRRIILTTFDKKSSLVDCEIEISAGDMVMLMNYYKIQKENRKPIL